MSHCSSDYKSGALPSELSRQCPEILSKPGAESATRAVEIGSERQNAAGTGEYIPGIVPNRVREPFGMTGGGEGVRGDIPPPMRRLRKDAKWRRVTRAMLRSRDGCMCYWCGEPMNFAEGRPRANRDPLFATIEHLVERCNGGGDDEGNLVLAHHRCNRGRDRVRQQSARTPQEQAA